jgi:RNA exonuclease 1
MPFFTAQLTESRPFYIGHSLENDLNVLRIMHRAAVDTSLMFHTRVARRSSPALRVLTERLLNRRIQDGSHDSVADAAATMALARLKFAKGPAFGEVRPDGVPLADVLSDAGQASFIGGPLEDAGASGNG